MFVNFIYVLTKKDTFKNDLDLVRRVRGCAVSLMAQIAEGFRQNSTQDCIWLMDSSRSLTAETINYCYVALDQEYISDSEITLAKLKADAVSKKIDDFMAYTAGVKEKG